MLPKMPLSTAKSSKSHQFLCVFNKIRRTKKKKILWHWPPRPSRVHGPPNLACEPTKEGSLSLSPKLGPSIEAMPMVLCIGQCTIQPGWAQRRVKCIVRRANNRGCRPPHLTSRHSSSVDPFQHSAKSPLPCVSLIGLRHILYFCVPEMVLMQYTHKI